MLCWKMLKKWSNSPLRKFVLNKMEKNLIFKQNNKKICNKDSAVIRLLKIGHKYDSRLTQELV